MLRVLNKKGQTGGLVTGLVFGIAALVIGVIIAFVITSTLSGAGLLDDNRATVTVLNENPAWINTTTYSLDSVRGDRTGYTILQIENLTDGSVIATGNYSLSSGGVLTNVTTHIFQNASINYTYSQFTNEEVATTALTGNFTAGVDNISAKIPTILLIAAIVLILGVLAVLVAVWQKMRLGGGSTI